MSTDKNKFIFLRHFQNIEKLKQSQYAQERIVTCNIHAFYELKRNGFHVNGTWEYIDDKAHREVILRAVVLKDTWYKDFCKKVEYRHINMMKIIKYFSYHFFLEALASCKFAERFFKVERPDCIKIQSLRSPLSYETPLGFDVPEAIIAYYAEKWGVRQEWMRYKPFLLNACSTDLWRSAIPMSIRKMREDLLNKLKRQKQICYGANEIPLERAIKSLEFRKNRRLAIIVSSRRFVALMLPLVKVLEETEKWNTLLINAGSLLDFAGLSRSNFSIDFRYSDKKFKFSYVELLHSFDSSQSTDQKFAYKCWESFLDWKKKYKGLEPALFSNDLLEFQFKSILLDPLISLGRVVDWGSQIFKRLKPDIVFTDNSPDENIALAAVAQHLQIPMVLIPHNRTWAFPEQYDYPADYIAVQSQAIADFLKDLIGEKKTLIIGDIKSELSTQSPVVTKRTKSQKKILVLTGDVNREPRIFQYFNQGAFCQSLEAIAHEAFKENWEVVFRPHPRSDSYNLIKTLVQKSKKKKITFELKITAEKMIPSFNIVVCLDYLSSPIIAAWKAAVPVIFWESSDLFYGPTDMFQRDWFPTVKNIVEFKGVVDRFFRDSEWRSFWLEKGKVLADELSANSNFFATNFVNSIEKILEKNS